MSFWTDERIVALKVHFEAGLSASEIGRELGAPSRSSVIGKLHRLGLNRGLQPRPAQTAKPKAHQHGPLNTRRIRDLARIAAAPPIAPAPAVAPSSAHRCGLLELRNESCRWPVTDGPPHAFCGDPTADLANGRPYCAWHTRIAHDRSGDREEAA